MPTRATIAALLLCGTFAVLLASCGPEDTVTVQFHFRGLVTLLHDRSHATDHHDAPERLIVLVGDYTQPDSLAIQKRSTSPVPEHRHTADRNRSAQHEHDVTSESPQPRSLSIQSHQPKVLFIKGKHATYGQQCIEYTWLSCEQGSDGKRIERQSFSLLDAQLKDLNLDVDLKTLTVDKHLKVSKNMSLTPHTEKIFDSSCNGPRRLDPGFTHPECGALCADRLAARFIFYGGTVSAKTPWQSRNVRWHFNHSSLPPQKVALEVTITTELAVMDGYLEIPIGFFDKTKPQKTLKVKVEGSGTEHIWIVNQPEACKGMDNDFAAHFNLLEDPASIPYMPIMSKAPPVGDSYVNFDEATDWKTRFFAKLKGIVVFDGQCSPATSGP